jgi:hypothetical protein
MTPTVARDLLERVMGARLDAASCIYFLCTRRARQMTRAGALWPIRNTLRGFLVWPEAATRQLMRKLEPLLQERADTEEGAASEGAAGAEDGQVPRSGDGAADAST